MLTRSAPWLRRDGLAAAAVLLVAIAVPGPFTGMPARPRPSHEVVRLLERNELAADSTTALAFGANLAWLAGRDIATTPPTASRP